MIMPNFGKRRCSLFKHTLYVSVYTSPPWLVRNVRYLSVFLASIDGLGNPEEERATQEKELAYLQGFLVSVDAKLQNERFVFRHNLCFQS